MHSNIALAGEFLASVVVKPEVPARARVGILCLMTVLAARVCPAQGQCTGTWLPQPATGTTPGPRRAPAMAFDSVRNLVLLFGGDKANSINSGPRQPAGDLWSWDGSSWQMIAASGPSPRYHARLAFDPSSGRTYLFGGYNGTSYSGELWAWNGTRWDNLTATAGNGPSPRAHSGVAFDSRRGRLVVFGGLDAAAATRRLGDTWEFDGTTWSRVTLPGPSARSHLHMAFDEHRGTCLLVGGITTTGVLSDTWEYDGSAWTQRLSNGSPIAEATSYSPQSQRVLLCTETGTAAFEWTGSSWTSVATNVQLNRFYQGFAYDSFRSKFVLYGGASGSSQTSLGDTWELVLFGVLTQPATTSACVNSSTSFSIAAAGAGPHSYIWRKDSLPIDPISNPSASTATLLLANTAASDAGNYDCIVTNACGSVTSNAASLTVCRCLTCAADFNEDGGVDGEDVSSFFSAWETGSCDADVNSDGGTDGDDVGVFFSQWEAGGC